MPCFVAHVQVGQVCIRSTNLPGKVLDQPGRVLHLSSVYQTQRPVCEPTIAIVLLRLALRTSAALSNELCRLRMSSAGAAMTVVTMTGAASRSREMYIFFEDELADVVSNEFEECSVRQMLR